MSPFVSSQVREFSLAPMQGPTDLSGLPVPVFQFGESLPGCKQVGHGRAVFDFVDAGTRNPDYLAQLPLRDTSFSAQRLEPSCDSGLRFCPKVHCPSPGWRRKGLGTSGEIRVCSRGVTVVPSLDSGRCGRHRVSPLVANILARCQVNRKAHTVSAFPSRRKSRSWRRQTSPGNMASGWPAGTKSCSRWP